MTLHRAYGMSASSSWKSGPLGVAASWQWLWIILLVQVAASMQLSVDAGGHATSSIQSIPLQKQYVPVSVGGKVVAHKTAYYGQVYAGGPNPQNFTVVFDTGSGHVILPSTRCDSETCMKHRRYNRAASSTALDMNYDGKPVRPSAADRDQLVVSFGTGQVRGEFVEEKICLSTGPNDCVSLRIVLAMSMTPDPFSLFFFDGVLGLGLTALTLRPQFGFMDQMIAQRPGMQPRFAVFLSRTDKVDSVISFGGHDERMASSEFVWAPVARASLGFWQVNVKAVRINGVALDVCANGDCHAILDTGTSLLAVPRPALRTMTRMLARPVPESLSAHGTEVDCRNVPGAKIEFDLGGFVVSLGEEDYSRPAPLNMTTGDNASALFCRSLLLPLDLQAPIGPNSFIWGEPMLRKYYTIYDVAMKQIGFSLAREPLENERVTKSKPIIAIDEPPSD